MATQGVKYLGKLGKPMTEREVYEGTKELLGAQGGDLKVAFNEWLAQREIELLFALLDHYGIARNDQSSWFALSYKLAIDNVPAFRYANRGRGRPLKQGLLAGVGLAGLLPKLKRKPGRKQEWTDEAYRALLKAVRDICAAQRFKGRGAVTKALTAHISDRARAQGESVHQAARRDLPKFRKRYSVAKRKFPELARKLPR
jgi:hypothetical protein